MYAIAFDMVIANLKENYGEPYHNAYAEIKKVLGKHGFHWVQGSTYASQTDNLLAITQAVTALRQFDWFCKSVRDIRAFKIEDWSDFTGFFKN
jgi:virulence-associated protein VapD